MQDNYDLRVDNSAKHQEIESMQEEINQIRQPEKLNE